MSFKLVREDPQQRLYTQGSFLLNIHWDDTRAEHLRAISEVCGKIIKETGSLTSLVLLRGRLNVDLSADVRKEAAALTEKCSPFNAGQALVIEANGFVASLARSVLTGVNLVARTKTNQRVFQDPREAAEWLFGLPSQPPAIRDSLPKLWPQIQALIKLDTQPGAAQLAG